MLCLYSASSFTAYYPVLSTLSLEPRQMRRENVLKEWIFPHRRRVVIGARRLDAGQISLRGISFRSDRQYMQEQTLK